MLLCLSSIFIGCRNENTLVDAVIIDSGDVSADGCGWIVNVGNDYFHPQSLEAIYQVDGLHVIISYRKLNSQFMCGIGGLLYDEIEITDIEPQ